jgi:hypothetical protein
MNLNFITKNKKKFHKYLIFISAFLLIFLTFQKERKFRFEFQKGTPWEHDDLFAPFDFPVYKLDNEIQKEIDSIYNNKKISFIYDKQIEEEQLKKLNNAFEQEWKKTLKLDSIQRKTDRNYRRKPKPNKYIFEKYYKKLIGYLDFVYQKGIFDPSKILKYTNKSNYKLVFQKNKFVNTYTRDQVFSLKSAFEYVNNKLNDEISKSPEKDKLSKFFDDLEINQFISQNLFFNKQKTEEYTNLALENISKTRGFIQAGELIISKGEIITLDKYRILLSLKNYYEYAQGSYSLLLIRLGNAIVVLLLLLMLTLYLHNNKKDIFDNSSSFLFIFLLLVIFVDFSNLVMRLNLFSIYIFPIALLPLIIKTFFDERLALYVLLTSIILIGFNAANGFEFIVIQFIGGFFAIFGISHLNRRGQLYISAISAFVSMSIIYFAIAIIQEASLKNIDWINFLYFAIYGLLLLSAYPLIYLFEKIFGMVSDLTLLELSNTNHALLQKLAHKAPGTFQHSLQVANMAEAAANKIGANSLLVRVGALYHDIGKTKAPAFFIENQVTGYNPHDQIDFDQSAQIIIGHVTNGIALATKHNLPQQITDFIRTHHGTTQVQYFYKNYIKKYPEKKDEIDKFTYPGPKPFSKETVILMMADSLEAASRSLKEINKEKIQELVDRIIEYQMNARQYDEANITFKEINTLKQLFKDLLINIYHARIEYPK